MSKYTVRDQPLRSNEFLEKAMRRWGNTVLRLALNQTGNPADAEDIFQDVFIKLMKDATHFADDEHLKAWLLRVTINRCFDMEEIGMETAQRAAERAPYRHGGYRAPRHRSMGGR